MKYFSQSQAVAAITAALQSQSIKLRGPNSASTPGLAVELANLDAKYLVTLLTQLQSTTPGE